MKNNIAKYVKKLKEQGVTVTEIIQASGIGRTSFYDIMNGKQIPKIDTALRIAEALQADIKNIFPELNSTSYIKESE